MESVTGRGRRQAALVLMAVLALMVLLPASHAAAQYPPPTPTPTSSPGAGGELECTVEVEDNTIVIRCTGSGFLPGAEVLAQVYGVGCTPLNALAPSTIAAAPLAGEELLATETVIADANGDIALEIALECCDLTALRVVATGPDASGTTQSLEDVLENLSLLTCVAGGVSGEDDQLATTGFDWLRWFALGLVLVTTGAWIANVRDERTPSAFA